MAVNINNVSHCVFSLISIYMIITGMSVNMVLVDTLLVNGNSLDHFNMKWYCNNSF